MEVPESGHTEKEVTLSQMANNISASLPAWGDTATVGVELLDVVYEVENVTNSSQYAYGDSAPAVYQRYSLREFGREGGWGLVHAAVWVFLIFPYKYFGWRLSVQIFGLEAKKTKNIQPIR